MYVPASVNVIWLLAFTTIPTPVVPVFIVIAVEVEVLPVWSKELDALIHARPLRSLNGTVAAAVIADVPLPLT
jgi:hypothetical protein